MNATVISIILWVPFGISVLVSALVFCIGGYRKGAVWALAGLAATLVATLLSAVLANLLAYLFTLGSAGGVEAYFWATAKRVFLCLVFFWLLLPLLTGIFRSVAGKLIKKRTPVTECWKKLLGLAVGLICALTFSLFWLSPLYGTLAMVEDTADSLMAVMDSDDAETKAMVNAAVNHPVVKISGVGPVKWVHGSVARVSANGRSFSVTSMMDAAEHCVSLLGEMSAAEDPREVSEMATELVKYIHTDVTDQVWFYYLYKDFLTELQKNIQAMEKLPVAEVYSMCHVLIDEDGDGEGWYETYYQDDQGNLLSLTAYIEQEIAGGQTDSMQILHEVYMDEDGDGKGIYVSTEASELYPLEDSYFADMGTITDMSGTGMTSIFSAGRSMTAVPPEIKDMLPLYSEVLDTLDVDQQTFAENMDNLFVFLSGAMEDGLLTYIEKGSIEDMYAAGIVEKAGWLANSTDEAVAVKKLMIFMLVRDSVGGSAQIARELTEEYGFGMITDPEQQTQEAALLLKGMLGGGNTMSEFVSGHPSLGTHVFLELAREYGVAELSGLESYQAAAYRRLVQADPSLEGYILERCRENTGDPNGPSITECCQGLLYVPSLLSQSEGWGWIWDDDPPASAVAFAMEYYGPELPNFNDLRLSADIIYRVLLVYPEALTASGLQPEDSRDMFALMLLLDNMLLLETDSPEEYINCYWDIEDYIDDPVSTAVVKYIVDTRGSDPLEIRELFSQEGELPAELQPSQEWLQEHTARMEDNLAYLKAFLGF